MRNIRTVLHHLMRATATALMVSGIFGCAFAQQTKSVSIGVLTDMSGPIADDGGPGSVAAAKMAIEDFSKTHPNLQAKLLSADHQNKPDVAVNIARRWFDSENVGAIFDLANSAVAIAVQDLARDKSRLTVATTAGSTSLIRDHCSPTGFTWAFNTAAVAKAMASSLGSSGKKTWFFITADYAFGHSLENEMTKVIKEANGKILGSVKHPLNTADMSSYITQAIASKADVIVMANGGADLVTSLRQSREFGVTDRGQTIVTPLMFIAAVHAIGPADGEGLLFASGYDWTLNQKTSDWAQRFFKASGKMPSQAQAGVYSSVTHYLDAVAAIDSTEGKAVAAKMRETPVVDMFTENGRIAPNGMMQHDMFVLQIKSPSESKSEWDLYKRAGRVAAATAFGGDDDACAMPK